MKDIQTEVDKINELVKADVTKAYAPFIELYDYCKESNQLEKLAQTQINLINSDRVDNVTTQFKALILLTSLYEGENNYNHFKTRMFIGRLYTRLNQFHKSLSQLKKALNYFLSIKEIIRIIHCYSCLGLLYQTVKHYEDSLKYFHEGLAIVKNQKEKITETQYNKQLEVYTYNIALTNFYSKNYKESEKFILQSIKLNDNKKIDLSMFHLINILIHLKIKLNQTEDVEKLIKDLLAIENIKESKHYCLLMSTIADYKEYLGDYDEASKYIKKAINHCKDFFSNSSFIYDEMVNNGLNYAFKRNDLKDIAWYSKKMQEIKKTQHQESLHYSVISLKQLDEISELELEKKQLEEISYILGHDLKTPIRIVKNMADIILQEPDTLEDLVPKIISNSNYALDLINATLDFSKLTLNFNPFKKVSLTTVLDNVVNNLEPVIKEHNAKIVLEKLPSIYGNYSLLTQLFTNLISNAIKYNNGNPNIEISYETINKNQRIEVKDNGIGIPEKELNKIFRLFKKSTINNKEQGTGVGLAICKKIVEMHKGTIYAKSKVAEGTSFFIEFASH